MLIDRLTQFCNATAADTGGTGLALIGDQIDLESARDIGAGKPIYLVIQVTTAFDSANDTATVSFVLASDASAAIADDGSASVHLQTPALLVTALVAGYRQVFAVPQEGVAYERYVGLLQNVGVQALTAGAISAFLTLTPPRWEAQPDGI